MVPLPSAQPAPSLRPAPSHISLRKSHHSSSSPLPSPSFLELPDSRRSSTYGLGPKDVDPRKTSRKKASFDSSQSDLPAQSPARPQRNDSYDNSLAPPTFASSFASIPLPPSNHQNDGKNVKWHRDCADSDTQPQYEGSILSNLSRLSLAPSATS